MSDDSENFDELKRLLALKRHENPPPGFFRDLPGRVLSQIEAEKEASAAGWWSRVMESVRLRPAFASAFAMGLCAILIVVVYQGSRPGETAPATGQSVVNNPFYNTNQNLTSPPSGTFDPLLGPGVQRASSKTNISGAPR